jgi:glycosyltransferase involved in cell wall biosynthesis
MRVLYIGVYLDGTGWGMAAEQYIRALDAAGVDVVCRPLKLNDVDHKPHPRVLELERKSAAGCDVCVQHVLPHQTDFNGRFGRNVAMFATESSDFRASAWADRVNAMDRAVVFNRQSRKACLDSGVKVPVFVVPHATDVERFQRAYDPLDLLKPTRERGEFNFYTVGEFVRRKNFAALVKAFHLEFGPDEPVNLVLKTSVPGQGPDAGRETVENFCREVKRGLKLHGGALEQYKQEIVVTDRLTEQGMMRLHAGCDVFVQPSYGEAWSIPAFDAMAMGKTPIVTAATGYLDYVSDAEGWLVGCREEPAFGAFDTFEDLLVGEESWHSVDVNRLQRCMRGAYADSRSREDKAARGIAKAYEFSHEAVGALLRRALESDDEAARLDGPA